MSAILYLDDGRSCWGSNIAASGVYFLVAREVRRPRLRLWLFDLSEQCAPFFDIDTRALSREDRKEFWAAAQRAFDELVARLGPGLLDRPNSWTADLLHRLLEEKDNIARGVPPSPDERREDVIPIDIEEDRWLTDEEAEALFEQREAAFLRGISGSCPE